MRLVVANGTATCVISSVPGGPVYGKTGTAEYGTSNPRPPTLGSLAGKATTPSPCWWKTARAVPPWRAYRGKLPGELTALTPPA